MRNRLSYANVIATLALFFALTGGAWAATSKYLMASDPITQGDLAGSTYGNPVIAAGKVTTAKIADGAITSAKFASSAKAPDADKLDGNDASAFGAIVARGTVSLNFGELAAGQCDTEYSGVLAGVDAQTDFALVNQTPSGITFTNTFTAHVYEFVSGSALGVTACAGDAGLNLGTVSLNYLIVR